MSEFILFNQALKQFEQTQVLETPKPSIDSSCSHTNTISEKGIEVCVDCGEEIHHKIDNAKEWRYYGQGDTKHVSDPTRVQMRKTEDRNIYKDVENLGFSESIVSKANKIYIEVSKGKILRGNSRKALVFACIFHAFKLSGRPQCHDNLINIFGLSKKTGLRGLKQVNLNAPKTLKIQTTYITPVNLIGEILTQFSATKEQEDEVIKLYNSIKNKSSRLNRSRPQSVASAVVYFWIRLKKKEITLKEFAKRVTLSELTINKIAKEIADVLETPNVI
jgi:transcription initiation factor TFIIIB Brf1 subunit/transcription initiation factor TFIIB